MEVEMILVVEVELPSAPLPMIQKKFDHQALVLGLWLSPSPVENTRRFPIAVAIDPEH